MISNNKKAAPVNQQILSLVLISGFLLILSHMIPEAALAPAPAAGEMEANPVGMEDTRKWSSGVGLWGKRSESAVDDQQFLAFIDAQQNGR